MIKHAHAITFEEISTQLLFLAENDKVISHNIANVNTPNYLPKTVISKLDNDVFYLDMTNEMHISFSSETGSQIIEREIIELKPNGNGVTVEHELAEKNENSLKIKELANVFAKQKTMIQTALSGGK